MQLFFIRHGQSTNNLIYAQTGTYDGRSDDPELSELGTKQASCLADWFSSGQNYQNDVRYVKRNGTAVEEFSPPSNPLNPWGITHIYTSPMVRAAETGYAISSRLGLPFRVWPDLHEKGGIYLEDPDNGGLIGMPGKSRSYFLEHFSNILLPDEVTESGWWNRSYETKEELNARGIRVAAQLRELHENSQDRVIFVSHGEFYNEFLWALLNESRHLDFWFFMNNTGITRIDFPEGEVDVIYTNNLNHLPFEWIT